MPRSDSVETAKTLPKPERRVLRPNEAAQYLGYNRATAAFYRRCDKLGIAALWGGAYDKVKIDEALDRATGFAPDNDYGSVDYGAD